MVIYCVLCYLKKVVTEFILQFEPCSCMPEVYYVRKEIGSGKYGDPVKTSVDQLQAFLPSLC
jgi:hypothetical protein